MSEPATENETAAEPAPLFGSWRNAYLFVVAVFVIDVVILYAFGRYFA